MIPRKFNIYVALQSYGGNGSFSSTHPDVMMWLGKTIIEMKADPRINDVMTHDICDTPITMVRNRHVEDARKLGADFILMLDSDMQFDCALGEDPFAKPFWQTSFDYAVEHFDIGPVVVGAPYSGPPPHANVYAFYWANFINSDQYHNPQFKLEQYTRREAEQMDGIQDCGALATGCILYDLRVFDHIPHPYFYYEFTDKTESEKSSTEDVTNTRDISLAIQAKLGYNPCKINWDAWAGHWKPLLVGKPKSTSVDAISKHFKEAIDAGVELGQRKGIIDQSRFTAEQLDGAVTLTASKPVAPVVDPLHEELRATFPEDLAVLQDLVKSVIADPSFQFQSARQQPWVAEVGTLIGDSAKAMADAGAAVCTYDNYEGSPNDYSRDSYLKHGKDGIIAKRNANLGDRLGRSVTCVEADSITATNDWKDGQLDMVFIDANHDYEAVKADIEAWLPKVKPGGILCGHDYGLDMFPGVAKAVHELLGPSVPHRGSVWFYHVPKTAPVHHELSLNGA